MFVTCDFHNHSCLSPCGSLEQSPAVLARIAAERGLGLVALTDHNSALNTPAFAVCAEREGIAALYGMEAASAEEVHVLCLFATPEDALDFGEFLLENLPRLRYDPERFGDQVVVDADENILEMPEMYFGAALELGFDDLCAEAHSWGALVIPAHIDRPLFGVINQLGFLPEGPYAAVEAVRPLAPGAGRGYTVVTGSDAHHPEHIARRPFALDLPDDWRHGGTVNLDALRAALAAGRVRLPFAP
jgi:3',5'-nucleoside bisphosphate phosphatase